MTVSVRVLPVTPPDRLMPELIPVDDAVLDQIVDAAITDASADEVTPPLSAANEWTPERIAWLRDYHRANREGLAGPTGEATWAVVVSGEVIGSVRLKRTDQPYVFETGIWLTRSSRGHGIGSAVMTAVLLEATAGGASTMRAETAESNGGALSVLRRLGFRLLPAEEGRVHALLGLNATNRTRQRPLHSQ